MHLRLITRTLTPGKAWELACSISITFLRYSFPPSSLARRPWRHNHLVIPPARVTIWNRLQAASSLDVTKPTVSATLVTAPGDLIYEPLNRLSCFTVTILPRINLIKSGWLKLTTVFAWIYPRIHALGLLWCIQDRIGDRGWRCHAQDRGYGIVNENGRVENDFWCQEQSLKLINTEPKPRHLAWAPR